MICLKLSGSEEAKGVCHELKPAELDAPCVISADSEVYYGLTYTTDSMAPPLAYCSVRAGRYCDLDGDVCRARLPATIACTAREQCEDGLVCVETCREPTSDGSPCTDLLECGSASRCIGGTSQPARFVDESVCGGDLD